MSDSQKPENKSIKDAPIPTPVPTPIYPAAPELTPEQKLQQQIEQDFAKYEALHNLNPDFPYTPPPAKANANTPTPPTPTVADTVIYNANVASDRIINDLVPQPKANNTPTPPPHSPYRPFEPKAEPGMLETLRERLKDLFSDASIQENKPAQSPEDKAVVFQNLKSGMQQADANISGSNPHDVGKQQSGPGKGGQGIV